MRRNRRNYITSAKTSARRTIVSYAIGLIILLGFIVIVNATVKTKVSTLQSTIAERQRVLARCEDELVRQSALWAKKTTPEGLERQLRRHSLAMRSRKPLQIVRMRANGQPVPGQLSVAKARQREERMTASYNSPLRRR